tara:strand:+ start:223 stop:714 length:492 start_codon:yes stop_codon:yes gene_type:complete
MDKLFSFPNPVNDYAARAVAAIVIILVVLFEITANEFLLLFITYGFLARVLTGPTLSPVGLLATKIIVPALGSPSKLVPGPPKRFAQFIGLLISLLATIAIFVFDSPTSARYLMAVICFFASLESILGFCAGCFVFGWLMKLNLIPESVCESCLIDVKTIDLD